MKSYESKASAEEIKVKDDPAARSLLRRAYDTTYRWSKDFKGFFANLEASVNGKAVKGSAEVKLPDMVNITLPDENIEKWANAQVGMMAVHRGYRTFEESDGKNILTLGERGSHPLGQCILIHGDGMNSRYRIKENRIAQISRAMGPVRFTINIQDAMMTQDGKYLNTRYVVYYFSPGGDLKQVECFDDEPVSVNGVYLPGKRLLILSEEGEVRIKQLIFSNHRLL